MNAMLTQIDATLDTLPFAEDYSEDNELAFINLSAPVPRPTSDEARKWRLDNKRPRMPLDDAKNALRSELQDKRNTERDALIERIGHVTIASGRASYKVLALRSSLLEFRERIAAMQRPQRPTKINGGTRDYPKFVPGMTTADYVRRYIALNVGLNLSRPEFTCANYTDRAPMLDLSEPEVEHWYV